MSAYEKIERFRSAFESASSTLTEKFTSYFDENREVVEDEIVMQLRRGQMPDGSKIEPAYDNVYSTYAWMKRNDTRFSRYDLAERPYYTPNLGLTGNFYSGITVVIEADAVSFTSTDSKWEHNIGDHDPLRTRYGDVLGLSAEYVDTTVKPAVKEAILADLRDKLGI